MRENHTQSIERHCDVAVIGGSAAGLAAALQLGRQRRSVLVVDAGEPRNAPASHMHSYLGHEGRPPDEFSTIACEEVRSYGGEILTGRAIAVASTDDGRFRVELTGGNALIARRVLAATGLVDVLPDISGLREHWGSAVLHCPFCHGYEVRDRRIVQIITHPIGLHSAGLFRQLTDQLTLVLHDGVAANDPSVEALRRAGVTIVDEPVRQVITDSTGMLTGIELEDDRCVDADAIAIATHFSIRTEPFQALDVATVAHPSGLGDVIDVDATGETSVPGLYAAGNVTDPVQQVLQAAANGSSVAGMISLSLARDDIETASRTTSNQADWEHRYGGDRIWSGNPNGTLVREVSLLTPGRALDVGAGEGGDAIWLAEHGWHVTASDISRSALERISTAANERELNVKIVHGDANALDPLDGAAFELVTAHYLSVPRTPDKRAVHNILRAVAPGGTLLVVGHDPQPMRAAIDTREQSRLFDPDAYVSIDDFVEAITGSPDWHIVSHDRRRRPPGAATASLHVDDIVLRAYHRTRCSLV